MSTFREVKRESRTEAVQHQSHQLATLGLLAHWVANDLYTLLTDVLMQTLLAAAKQPPQGPAHSHLSEASKVAADAAELALQLRHLLTYTNQGSFQVEPVDLNQLIEESRNLFQAWSTRKVDIRVDLTGGLPAIVGHRSQLQRVLLSLLMAVADAIETIKVAILVSTDQETVTAVSNKNQCMGNIQLASGNYVCLIIQNLDAGRQSGQKVRVFDSPPIKELPEANSGFSALLDILSAHKGGMQMEYLPGQNILFKVFLPVDDRPQTGG